MTLPDGPRDHGPDRGPSGNDGRGEGGRTAHPAPRLTVRASPARRAAGAGMLGLLGAILLWVALAAPPSAPGWSVFLLAFGALAIFGGWRLWQATAPALVLTGDGLADTTGRTIARLDDIVAVERGMLAFKPSNGFLLQLSRPAPRHWSPGLWWRLGRRVGVGGVTGAGETRAMADLIALALAERNAGSAGAGSTGRSDDQKHS
ncbi:MAG: hypothetical protein V2I65_16780 [Paracoccaceae bacterium]|nr:hypothetical protein [Paracoccaceae bacterium]